MAGWYHRKRDAAYPCLVAAVVSDLAKRQGLEPLPADSQAFSGPFSQRERLIYHLVLFLMGASALVKIHVSGTPHLLWVWPWVLGWAALLLIHAGIVLLPRRFRRRRLGAEAS